MGKRWLIIDFGFAMFIDGNTKILSHRRRGTFAYRAPELAEKLRDSDGHSLPGEVSRKTDIWAIGNNWCIPSNCILGCILFRVASTNKAIAFPNDIEAVQFKCNLAATNPKLESTSNSSLQEQAVCPETGCLLSFVDQINLIFKICFARDPKDRATAFELLRRFERMRQALLESRAAVGLQ